jgi:DNA-binding transcriptional MocR family regulator
MQKLNGFIKVHRKLVQWGWYKDSVVKDLFIHLLLTASFRDVEWMGRTIKKGQLVTSNKSLAEELGFSVQQIRTALNKLKSTGEITSEATNKFTVITLVNWEKYQVLEIPETNKTTNEQQTSNKQTTNEQQHRKNINNYYEECKEEKEIKASPSSSSSMTKEEYDAWWRDATE